MFAAALVFGAALLTGPQPGGSEEAGAAGTPPAPSGGHADPDRAAMPMTPGRMHGPDAGAMPPPGHTPAGAGEHGVATPRGATADNPVAWAYREANERMHAGMSAPPTGDADRDFAAAMIAHHQGAVEMAEILLEHGRDPELRALAEEVVEVQRREIEFLRRWLAEHPAAD